MKRITTPALALLCGIESASSINWSLASKSFGTSDGSSERAGGYYVTVFLYSDYSAVMSAVSSLSAPPSETQVNAISTYVQDTGTTAKTGASSGVFDVSDTTYPSVTTVELFMIAWDADSIANASNYLVSDKVLSDATTTPDNPTKTGKFTSASYSNSSWTAVPEPSVALMGLLGIGMQIRRRKA